MKQFTISDIKSWEPHFDPSLYLDETWCGTVLDILNNNRIPFQDRLWVIMRENLVSEKLMRQFAVYCARQVQHLSTNARSLYALDVMEAYVENRWLVDDADYIAAWEAERDAVWAAAAIAATFLADNAEWIAAESAAATAALAEAQTAAEYAARTAAKYAARTAARDAARTAALNAAESAQEQKLREMLVAGIETGDTK